MEQNKLQNVALNQIHIQDEFWNKYVNLVDDVIIPFQWELINDNVEGAEKSYCIRNFRIASGQIEGEHQGMVFQDTDVAKWLEAVAYSLNKNPNPELEKTADDAIDLIVGAQCEDGYLNTYYTITGEKRWSDLFEGHELYTAGHMMEAAVAYYEATGKDKLLKSMCRFADYIYEVFGKGEGQIPGYPGHPEIELALVKMYHATKEKKYLELANYFVRTRGEQPCYFLGEKWNHGGQYMFPEFKDFGMDYTLADKPILQQTEAQGHAVRAVYLYSAMADLAGEYQDEEMLKACDTLWKNITEKKMYITGSIGSSYYGECFTGNYDLPNNTNYSETCATIGLAMFSNRMFQITKNGKYMDTVETALYNTLLSGTALDGKHFFYVNPLEVVPEIAENNTSMRHIKTVRQQWFGVACCPPNIARTLESLGNYMYAVDDTTIYSNLFIGSDITADIQGKEVTVSLKADYPRNGRLEYTISGAEDSAFTLAVRKPGYSENIRVAVNGEKAEYTEKGGYIYLNRTWKDGDTVTAELDVEFRFVYCNPNVPYNMGKVALLKGPWVYCLEEVDNGKHLSSVVVDPEQTTLTEEYDENLMNGTLCVKFGGKRIDYTDVDGKLYVSARPKYKKDIFRAIPYCCWNNRGKGEMLVWMRTMDVMK